MDSVYRAAPALPVNSQAARAPSIPHALLPAAILRPELSAHGRVLALALDLERPVPALAHAPARVVHRPQVKRRARSAPLHVAEAEVSNSTQRPKKAR